MRILFTILKFIVGLIILLTIISFFLPATTHFERSIVIKQKPEIVFEKLNNLKAWELWSPWHKKDSAMQLTYQGPESGLAAKYIWKSNNPQVGNGSLEITHSNPNDSLQTSMNFEGMGISYCSFKLIPNTDGTKLTWAMDSKCDDMPFLWRIPSKYFGLFVDKMLAPDFEAGLNSIKTLCETTQIPAYTVEEVTTTAQLLATCKATTNTTDIASVISQSYQTIGEFLMKNKLEQSGSVLAIYHSFSPEKIEMECAIPINKKATATKQINIFEKPSGTAALVKYYGPYEKTEAAHNAINDWIKTNNKTIVGSPWETYVTDPMVEKDTNKWLTEIYYPIQ
jgi:effector-binding domain-containing protein